MKMIKFFLIFSILFALCHSYPHRVSKIAKSLKYIGSVPTVSKINPLPIISPKGPASNLTPMVNRNTNEIVKKNSPTNIYLLFKYFIKFYLNIEYLTEILSKERFFFTSSILKFIIL